jgi:two-component system, OmpR family, KDP operon response regulator KdpE
MTRLLIVDGDAQLRHALGTALRVNGFDVVDADSGEEGLRVNTVQRPDAVILDLVLPGIDGMQVLREIRTASAVPVIVLTLRDLREDKVAALDAGADDYVTKPFDTEELLARIRAALRRHQPAATPPGTITFGELQIDLDRRVARYEGELLRLTRTELKILEVLASNPGRLVTYEFLASRLDSDREPDVAVLRVHVGNLRRKLRDDAARPRLILTEPGLGYRWLPEVEPD